MPAGTEAEGRRYSASDLSMRVAVVQVGIVRVLVAQGLVVVPVGVRLVGGLAGGMGMAVVLVVDALGVAAVLPEAAVPEAEVPLLDVVPDAVVFEPVADSVALAAVWNDSKDFSAVGLTANT